MGRVDLEQLADLAQYNISQEHGFLPDEEPLTRFADSARYGEHDADVQDYLDAVDAFAAGIPDMVAETGLQHVRGAAHRLPQPPSDAFYDDLTDRELQRLYQATAFGASAYVHAIGHDAVDHLPDTLARPLYESTDRLDVPPILSYDAYSLYNWQLADPDGGLTLDNVDTVQNFMHLDDEDWFMLVHVEIEDEAARAVRSLPTALQAVQEDNPVRLAMALANMRDAFGEMTDTLARMPAGNSTDVYGHTFREYIEKFDVVTYEGVDALDGPQSWRGETGAQSSILPAVDGVVQVPHRRNALAAHVGDMWQFMPDGHRRFIVDVADAAQEHGVRDYITAPADSAWGVSFEPLEELYDETLRNMIAFRYLHREYARMYIFDEVADDTGTGGTPFPRFLSEFILETEEQLIRAEHREAAWVDYVDAALSGDRWTELNDNLAAMGKDFGGVTRPAASITDDLPDGMPFN